MSAICVLAPTIIAGWPAISAAVTGAAAALGMTLTGEMKDAVKVSAPSDVAADIPFENSEVKEGLATGESISMTKGDIQVRVYRDERGQCRVCVDGKGRSKRELEAFGKEVVGRVTQMFVYNKVMTELKAKGFTIAQNEIDQNQTVHIHVQRSAD